MPEGFRNVESVACSARATICLMRLSSAGVTGEVVECSLCRRGVPRKLVTLHHLLPKSRGGRAEDRVAMCKPCHKQIHATFTNRELEREYSNLDRLRAAGKIAAYMGWIVKQRADRNFRVRAAKGRAR